MKDKIQNRNVNCHWKIAIANVLSMYKFTILSSDHIV